MKYFEYSDCLSEHPITSVYLSNSSETYQLVSVKEIYTELYERGFVPSENATAYSAWLLVDNILQPANSAFNLSERYIDNTSGNMFETINNTFILLKNSEELLFPTEYDGSNDVKLYARDSVGTTLSSGSGNDTLYGGAKNDSILGNAGNDTAYGGNGSDTVRGGDDADIIYGASNDGTAETLVGTKGNYLYGEAGDDIIWAGGVGKDYLDGGEGNDTLNGSGLVSITEFGGAGEDSLTGASGNDILNGGEDNDTIQGYAGRDSIIGGVCDLKLCA